MQRRNIAKKTPLEQDASLAYGTCVGKERLKEEDQCQRRSRCKRLEAKGQARDPKRMKLVCVSRRKGKRSEYPCVCVEERRRIWQKQGG